LGAAHDHPVDAGERRVPKDAEPRPAGEPREVEEQPYDRERRRRRAREDGGVRPVERARTKRDLLGDRAQISTPFPDRARLTIIDASVSTTSVIRKSESPAAIRAGIPIFWLASPNRFAMRLATEFPPTCRMCGEMMNVGLMMMATAIVSPSARPRPSIEPPM